MKDVIDDIQVDPVSPMDDRIRIAVARAVYGFAPLNKYAIDPAKPIRISVQNGNVTLFGVVNSQADKNAAGIRANGVAGVFSVKNGSRSPDSLRKTSDAIAISQVSKNRDLGHRRSLGHHLPVD